MKIDKYATLLFPVLLIASLAGCTSIGQKQSAVESYVQDTSITTHVKAAIFQELDGNATEIHVETGNGTVRLSGFVSQPSQIEKADQIARSIEGVKNVKNNLMLK